MTAVKAKQENRVILDFSDRKYSKNQIKQSLRKVEILSQYEEGNRSFIFIQNLIKIGMYTIRLWLPGDASPNWIKLKDYNDFAISIHEEQRKPILIIKGRSVGPSTQFANDFVKNNNIELTKDDRFKGQYWVSHNFFGRLHIKHLIDIIYHCQRLNLLKAFL